MDALTLLHNRTSTPALQAPAPTPEQLDIMYRAALRAPDHACLRPWRFIEVAGDDLDALGEVFVAASAAVCDGGLSDEKAAKMRRMPHRAPMIIVAVATLHTHPKVPEIEQVITAGCAAQAVVQAAYAQGLGAMWRTGDLAFNQRVMDALGLASHEKLIGFIYIGTPMAQKGVPAAQWAENVTQWQPKV